MGVRKSKTGSNSIRRLVVPMRSGTVAITMVFAATLGGHASALEPGDVRIVSVNDSGRAGNAQSGGPAANENGSVVAFYSDANNLVPDDTNPFRDVFVRDFNTNHTERVSVGSGGQANGPSQSHGGAPAISADGNLVAFYSRATNLVPNDANGNQLDVFLRNRVTHETEPISISSSGEAGNGASLYPSMSANGRYVVFQSLANNLVPDDNNGVFDIFVRDRQEGTTTLACGASLGSRASFAPAISANGEWVAFAALAPRPPGGPNNITEIFVCKRNSNPPEFLLVSVNNEDVPGDGDSILPAINLDGNVVAFKSLATNLVLDDRNNVVDVFARDRGAVPPMTVLISASLRGGAPNDFSFPPSVDYTGRFVAFGSTATNLALGDNKNASNMFVRDQMINRTLLVDVNAAGRVANGSTPDAPPSVSGDAKQIAFVSFATNLVPNDRSGVGNVFIALNPFFGPGTCPTGECPDGLVCVDGFCVTPTPTPSATNTPLPTSTPTPTPTFIPCDSDDDCPPPKICRGGFCRDPRPCETFEMCYAREACVDDLCECGVDCNLDGYVLGNEITQGILILGGVAQLDTCPAADINGDGMVTGPEITDGSRNLREGCIQEGLPLTFSERGGMVTVEVSSAAAPAGGPVAVNIDLTGGNGQVATVQLDLLYDPNIVEIKDPASNCTVASRLGRHTLFASFPVGTSTPPGLRRLRLFVADITTPISTFDDGAVATCTFQTRPGAAGADALVVPGNLNVGDDLGQVFGSQGVSGALSILTPPPPPAPVCAGDCNGDGEVFASEITRAMAIMAGRALLADCPAADANGDGQVSVSDVTRAFLSLARGCPR
jgi:Tol biopolymer transport system component